MLRGLACAGLRAEAEGIRIGGQLFVLKAQGLCEYCLTLARPLSTVRYIHECVRDAKAVTVQLVPYRPVEMERAMVCGRWAPFATCTPLHPERCGWPLHCTTALPQTLS